MEETPAKEHVGSTEYGAELQNKVRSLTQIFEDELAQLIEKANLASKHQQRCLQEQISALENKLKKANDELNLNLQLSHNKQDAIMLDLQTKERELESKSTQSDVLCEELSKFMETSATLMNNKDNEKSFNTADKSEPLAPTNSVEIGSLASKHQQRCLQEQIRALENKLQDNQTNSKKEIERIMQTHVSIKQSEENIRRQYDMTLDRLSKEKKANDELNLKLQLSNNNLDAIMLDLQTKERELESKSTQCDVLSKELSKFMDRSATLMNNKDNEKSFNTADKSEPLAPTNSLEIDSELKIPNDQGIYEALVTEYENMKSQISIQHYCVPQSKSNVHAVDHSDDDSAEMALQLLQKKTEEVTNLEVEMERLNRELQASRTRELLAIAKSPEDLLSICKKNEQTLVNEMDLLQQDIAKREEEIKKLNSSLQFVQSESNDERCKLHRQLKQKEGSIIILKQQKELLQKRVNMAKETVKLLKNESAAFTNVFNEPSPQLKQLIEKDVELEQNYKKTQQDLDDHERCHSGTTTLSLKKTKYKKDKRPKSTLPSSQRLPYFNEKSNGQSNVKTAQFIISGISNVIFTKNRPKPVEPLDYETYFLKNKVLLQNDPHRELLVFPHDDILTPAPTPAKKIRTVHSTVPKLTNENAGNLLVEECLRTYTDTCHMIRFKYSKYSAGYQQLSNTKKGESMAKQIFEVDQEMDERDHEIITKAGWLYKGPDSVNDAIISFTRQMKRRYFCIKQQSDQTYSLEFFKDDRKSVVKGVVLLDCAQEVVKNPKKGKHCFEVRTAYKAYLFAAENEADMDEWIKTLNRVISAAETLSQISLDRVRDGAFSPFKMEDKLIENNVHPELTKYAKETDSFIQKVRQDGRQNLFSVYGNIPCHLGEKDYDDVVGGEVDVYPKQNKAKFMLRLLDFHLRLQVNLAEEGYGNKQCNPEPFFLTFTLYDVLEGRKISEDFHMDLNEKEIGNMVHTDKTEGKGPPPDLNGLKESWLLDKNRQGIFSVIRCHSEIYMYVRIEKVLQGPISQAVEPYLKGADTQTGSKVYRQMRQFCSHIGHFRMPFAWSARPLATSNPGPCEMPIYKQESSKLTEEEIIKHLKDVRRPKKQSKWQTIPGTLRVSISPLKAEPLTNTVTSSYVPMKPFPMPPADPVAVEIEEFVLDKGQFTSPHESYTNNLYVYPVTLKYDGQKSFTKARNIACCIEIRDSDDDVNDPPLKLVFSRHGNSVFSCSASTTVLHHNQAPDYMEEVKILLPPILHEKHHVLFRFYHVSCEGSKGSVKKRGDIEIPVGYAWVPLLHSSGRVEVGEKTIPVATNLPQRYLSHDGSTPSPAESGHFKQSTHFQASGTSTQSASSEVKWVDSAKPLFKVRLQLNSTIYTKDQHLHMFFFHCQKMMASASTGPDDLNKLKSLHAVDVSTYIQFLPTILNILFKLIANTQNEGIAMNAVRVIIHIVSEVQEADKTELLEKYVKYIFKADCGPKGSSQNTAHEELAKGLIAILRPVNADHVVVIKFFNNSWFFFEVLVKSMTQFLMSGDRYKMAHNERFSSDFQFKLQTLIQTITPYITSKYKEAPKETRNANFSLAYFEKMCFSLMDRGVVFQLISHHLATLTTVDHQVLHEYKFEFLRIVCSHEHYIPLSLPLMSKCLINTFKDLKSDYTLSEEYRKTHYLPGLLLQELKHALNEAKETRRCAISVLRDQFAKHAFDDRYSGKNLQGRIAALYLPFISVLLDNKHRLVKSDPEKTQSPSHAASTPSLVNGVEGGSKGDGVKGSTKGSTTSGYTPTAEPKPRSVISQPQPVEPTKRDSSVFDMIAGTKSHLNVEDLKSQIAGSSSSLNSSSGSSTDTKTDSGSLKERGKGHSRQGSGSTIIPGQGGAKSGKAYPYQKLDHTEIKDLLICMLHILKNLPDEILLGWFNNSSEYDIVDFFSLLELCLEHFKYLGKKKIITLSIIGESSIGGKANTLPVNRRFVIPTANDSRPPTMSSVSQYGEFPNEVPSYHMTTSSEADGMMRVMSEANLATETGMIILDVLAVYTEKFRTDLESRNGENTLMETVFNLYLYFLKTSQSETLQGHVFVVWRSFIRKFPNVLFSGDATLCSKLCYEVLRCCNSRLKSTRKEACILLYSLMKANFDFTKKKSFTRIHLQVIISVAQLIGNELTLSNYRFQESLALINSYATSDKTMNETRFAHKVKDLTKRIKTVLMATAQMKEHEQDPEMLIDLQYSLANLYASTPELRKTWLESMARIHDRNGNHSEAAHCYIHMAALVAEYLKKRGGFPQGCTAFKVISPNVEKEESGIKDNSGMQNVQYTEETLVTFMEKAADCLQKAERFEVLEDVYKIIIPMYERSREFEKLSQCHQILANSYTKVVEVMSSGKRLLGKYFRVAFFGQSFFDEEDGKQYVYKEPKVTSLAELCDRLKTLYAGKFGQENVKLIMDAKTVNLSELETRFAYIQVTHVTPFFKEKELQHRLTDIEKNNNVCCFMYESPFTKGNKAHGEIHEQYKQRTVLRTSHSFPFVKKRIEVSDKTECVLSPIEVAIDEMNVKVADLREVVDLALPDMKKLQLKLQGSVSAQVNAGPLAYVEAFLAEDKIANYPPDRVETLKSIFRDYVSVCNDSLDLNAKLITTEQKEYHESLKAGFNKIVNRLSKCLDKQNSPWTKKFIAISERRAQLSRSRSRINLNVDLSVTREISFEDTLTDSPATNRSAPKYSNQNGARRGSNNDIDNETEADKLLAWLRAL